MNEPLPNIVYHPVSLVEFMLLTAYIPVSFGSSENIDGEKGENWCLDQGFGGSNWKRQKDPEVKFRSSKKEIFKGFPNVPVNVAALVRNLSAKYIKWN